MRLRLRSSRIKWRLRRFHHDECGETNVLSQIMLLAIAALIIILLLAFGKNAMGWLNDTWKRIVG